MPHEYWQPFVGQEERNGTLTVPEHGQDAHIGTIFIASF